MPQKVPGPLSLVLGYQPRELRIPEDNQWRVRGNPRTDGHLHPHNHRTRKEPFHTLKCPSKNPFQTPVRVPRNNLVVVV